MIDIIEISDSYQEAPERLGTRQTEEPWKSLGVHFQNPCGAVNSSQLHNQN